jgi:hypothetical protein
MEQAERRRRRAWQEVEKQQRHGFHNEVLVARWRLEGSPKLTSVTVTGWPRRGSRIGFRRGLGRWRCDPCLQGFPYVQGRRVKCYRLYSFSFFRVRMQCDVECKCDAELDVFRPDTSGIKEHNCYWIDLPSNVLEYVEAYQGEPLWNLPSVVGALSE